MSPRLWPRTLFGRLVAVLFAGLLLTQAMSMWVHWSERDRVLLHAAGLNPVQRVADSVHLLDSLAQPERERIVALLNLPPLRLALVPPPPSAAEPEPGPHQRLFTAMLATALGDGYVLQVRLREGLQQEPALPMMAPHTGPDGSAHPMRHQGRHGNPAQLFVTHVRLHDGQWLRFDLAIRPESADMPLRLLASLVALIATALALSWWAVRWVNRPLKNLAQAADALGRNLHNPPLREDGPDEVRQAARAFNQMQTRLLRFLDDRTQVLAAMSHDLKTPLTRLRLRAELLDDDDLRQRFEKDLLEMEAMVTDALAALRGLDTPPQTAAEDIETLVQALAADQREMGRDVLASGHAGLPLVTDGARLRRALGNLIDNAVAYGQRARITLQDTPQAITITVRDDGPGIAPDLQQRVFDPFYRIEASRNRATGGTGLGLGIARNIVRGCGGELSLRNHPDGGLEVTVSLPR
jgi:signal transduction histidine kinase